LAVKIVPKIGCKNRTKNWHQKSYQKIGTKIGTKNRTKKLGNKYGNYQIPGKTKVPNVSTNKYNLIIMAEKLVKTPRNPT